MRIGMMAAVVGACGGLAMAGGNAALEYYRAWALMDDTREELIDTRRDEIMRPDGAGSVLGKYDSVIVHLLRASEMGDADWGIDPVDGPGTLLPHLGQIRHSARLMAAAALESAEDGELGNAAECLASLHVMSVHASSGDILICSLVGIAIGNLGIELTNQMIDDGLIDAGGARVVLESIGKGGETDRFGLRDAIVGEWRMIAEFLLARSPEEGAGKWLIETMGMEEDDAQTKRIAAMDKAALMRELGGWSAYYSDMLGAWDAGDRGRMDAVVERLKDGEYGTITVVMAASLTRAFDSDRKSTEDINALIERLEGIAD